MAGEIVAAVTSLGGVVLGGGLSFLVQNSGERRRQEAARLTARRVERLDYLERFVGLAAEAERVAFERPVDWADGEAWPVAAQDVMRRLWAAEHMMQVLHPESVSAAGRAYFERINRAVWDGADNLEQLYAELDELRGAFLTAARASLA